MTVQSTRNRRRSQSAFTSSVICCTFSLAYPLFLLLCFSIYLPFALLSSLSLFLYLPSLIFLYVTFSLVTPCFSASIILSLSIPYVHPPSSFSFPSFHIRSPLRLFLSPSLCRSPSLPSPPPSIPLASFPPVVAGAGKGKML